MVFYFEPILSKLYLDDPTHDNSILVPTMACRWTSDRPLLDTTVLYVTEYALFCFRVWIPGQSEQGMMTVDMINLVQHVCSLHTNHPAMRWAYVWQRYIKRAHVCCLMAWIWLARNFTWRGDGKVLQCVASRFDWLVQERRNSSALAMELRLSCINQFCHFVYTDLAPQ